MRVERELNMLIANVFKTTYSIKYERIFLVDARVLMKILNIVLKNILIQFFIVHKEFLSFNYDGQNIIKSLS